MDKIFELVEYINRHKKLSFCVNWFFYTSILMLSNLSVLSWQYWTILLVLVIINSKNYIDGRQDQEEFEKKWRRA